MAKTFIIHGKICESWRKETDSTEFKIAIYFVSSELNRELIQGWSSLRRKMAEGVTENLIISTSARFFNLDTRNSAWKPNKIMKSPVRVRRKSGESPVRSWNRPIRVRCEPSATSEKVRKQAVNTYTITVQAGHRNCMLAISSQGFTRCWHMIPSQLVCTVTDIW